MRNYWINYQFILIFSVFAYQPVINAQPTLVLNAVGQPPLNTETHDGFMDEVSREAMKRIGYKLVIDNQPAERALNSANKGYIDGEISRIKGLNITYNNLIRVPEKIMDWEFVVFSSIPVNLQQGWDSLANKNVAFINGWKILENSVPKTASITKTRNLAQLFTLLEMDRTDIIIYEHWGGNYVIKEKQFDNIRMRMPPLATREMFIYLHKKHAFLVPLLSQALIDMKRDGSYERLVKKHLTVLQKDN